MDRGLVGETRVGLGGERKVGCNRKRVEGMEEEGRGEEGLRRRRRWVGGPGGERRMRGDGKRMECFNDLKHAGLRGLHWGGLKREGV